MSGVTKKLSFTEKYFWSTQVPVFNYITKIYNDFSKTRDKEGFIKTIYNSLKRNLDNITDNITDKDLLIMDSLGTAMTMLAAGICTIVLKTPLTRNYIAAASLAKYVHNLLHYIAATKKYRNIHVRM